MRNIKFRKKGKREAMNKEERKEYNKRYHQDYREERNKRNRQHYQTHKEERKEYNRQYRQNHKEEMKEYQKQYDQKNKRKKKEYHKQYQQDYKKEIKERKRRYMQNPENREKINECNKIRQRTDLRYNLNSRMRSMIRISLHNGSGKQGRHWQTLVGYTVAQLKRHLKKTMPEDYSWQDYLEGKLHIDHIFPKAIFNFSCPEDIDFQRCWALKNLQLLPAEENQRKYTKLIKPFQIYLPIKVEVIQKEGRKKGGEVESKER